MNCCECKHYNTCNASELPEKGCCNWELVAGFPPPLDAAVRERQGAPTPELPPGIHHNTDARAWAKTFVEHVRWKPTIATDEETMVGWFANAMMAMHDEMQNRRTLMQPHEANGNIQTDGR